MKKYWKIILIGVLILILFILVVQNWDIIRLSFEYYSDYYFSKSTNPKGEMLKIVLSVAGAIAIMIGLYVSYRRVRAMEIGVEKQAESIQNQTDQLELSRKSQIDERFKNAIEHLGSDKEPIILGGIAELHQIAKENKENYAEIVFNILTSFVRANANKKIEADNINKTIIQTIVNYLFKKESNNGLYDNFKADLNNCNLLSVDLSFCNLVESNLSFCLLNKISNTDLIKSDLGKAEICLADIFNTDFTESNLRQSFFHFTDIKLANFSGSSISETIFLQCEIISSRFNNSKLFKTNFSSSLLKNLSFNNSSLIHCKLYCAHLQEIDLSNTKSIAFCDFRGASFFEVILDDFIMESNFKGIDQSINTAPKLYEKRLKERVWKENEIEISNLKYIKSIIGQLTDEDCKEIKDDIKGIQKEMYPNLDLDD